MQVSSNMLRGTVKDHIVFMIITDSVCMSSVFFLASKDPPRFYIIIIVHYHKETKKGSINIISPFFYRTYWAMCGQRNILLLHGYPFCNLGDIFLKLQNLVPATSSIRSKMQCS